MFCAAAPLRHIPVGSISPSSLTQFRTAGGRSCGIKLFSSRWRRDFAGRKRLYAQSQEGVDRETLNLTDLRNLQSSSRTPEPEPLPYYAGVSEEEIREALLFEQGDGDKGPRLEEAARAEDSDAVAAAQVYERTLPIPINRGNGETIVSMLTVFGGLLDRPFGSGAMVAGAGSAVIERAQIEIEKLKADDKVNEQLLFEVIRVIRLLDMDMKLISAAQKESTLLERLDSARKHCQEAIQLANIL